MSAVPSRISRCSPPLLVICSLLAALFCNSVAADSAIRQTKGDFEDKFRQLDEVLPTPNIYRNAAGEPGQQYWQQQVNYKMDVVLDEAKRQLSTKQQISYQNNSPYTLKYLWLHLDQNIFKNDSMAEMTTDFGGVGRRGPDTSVGSDRQRKKQQRKSTADNHGRHLDAN